jgi:hypothetical protein
MDLIENLKRIKEGDGETQTHRQQGDVVSLLTKIRWETQTER